MKVLITDDHKVVRLGLSMIIKEEYAKAEIFEASNAAEVLKHYREHRFDLVLMDLRMPDTDSGMLLGQVLAIDPNAKILIISLNPEKIFALRLLQMGAYGYIQKSEDDAEIKRAIIKVINGKKYMSEDVVEIIAQHLSTGNSSNPFDILTKREMEVTQHLIQGMSTNEICNLLSLQSSTISTFKTRIFEKLNLRSVHELAELAKQYDIF